MAKQHNTPCFGPNANKRIILSPTIWPASRTIPSICGKRTSWINCLDLITLGHEVSTMEVFYILSLNEELKAPSWKLHTMYITKNFTLDRALGCLNLIKMSQIFISLNNCVSRSEIRYNSTGEIEEERLGL